MPAEIPVPETGIPIDAIERPATQREIYRWERLLREHDRASIAIDCAGLLLFNIYTTWTFGSDNSIKMPSFDPALEKEYYTIRESFQKSKFAIRGVTDHVFGIRSSGNDIDIIEPPATSFGGWVIPVVLGIIVLGSAIGTAIYQSTIATKIANEYRKLLFDTDKMFCSEKNSPLCKKWKKYKEIKKYDQNRTMANSLTDTLKKGITTVSGGLATGLIVAIGLAVFLRRK